MRYLGLCAALCTLLISTEGFWLPPTIKPHSRSVRNHATRPSITKLRSLDDKVEQEPEPEPPAWQPPEDTSVFGGLSRWWETEGKQDVKVYGTSLAVALLVRGFIVEPRYIPSLSMFPTFEVGDQLAVDKISRFYRPYQRRDVVVFHPPEAFKEFTSRQNADEALIKRVVAVEGDTVQVRGGKLYINGELQAEEYVSEDAAYEFGPVTVPAGKVLVLGDNRNHSLDGHIWGFLPRENVIGRAIFKYWPPWRLGSIEQ